MDPLSLSGLVTVNNAIQVLQMTMNRVKDWQKVVPEGVALKQECHSFYLTIEDLLKKPQLPISEELESARTTITDANKLIKDFLDEDARKDRTGWDEIGWKVQRAYLAYSHRANFKATTIKLEEHKEKFIKILKYTQVLETPTAYWHKSSMTDDAFQFWKLHVGTQHLSVPWNAFQSAYERECNKNKPWSSDLAETIRRAACVTSEHPHLQIAGFISLTNHYGFPLDYDRLPSLMDSHAMLSAQARMDVAKMVNELITYYSTQEMRDLLLAIFSWYDGCKKTKRPELAKEWAETIKGTRGKPKAQWTDREKLAERVDMARRTYSFFFQRYMVVFKIGQLSKDMFADVDFPGKARMLEFIDHVEPLDQANFIHVMNKKQENWKQKKPKVYKFLEEYIHAEEQAKLIMQQEEEKAQLQLQQQQEEEKAQLQQQQEEEEKMVINMEAGTGTQINTTEVVETFVNALLVSQGNAA